MQIRPRRLSGFVPPLRIDILNRADGDGPLYVGMRRHLRLREQPRRTRKEKRHDEPRYHAKWFFKDGTTAVVENLTADDCREAKLCASPTWTFTPSPANPAALGWTLVAGVLPGGQGQIQRGRVEGEAKGNAEGMAKGVLKFLEKVASSPLLPMSAPEFSVRRTSPSSIAGSRKPAGRAAGSERYHYGLRADVGPRIGARGRRRCSSAIG